MPFFQRRTAAGPDVEPDARFTVDAAVRVTGATGDGRVILHTRTARVWVLNGSGAEIWDRLDAGCALDHIAGELVTRYGGDPAGVRADLAAFARRLLDAGLLHVRSTTP